MKIETKRVGIKQGTKITFIDSTNDAEDLTYTVSFDGDQIMLNSGDTWLFPTKDEFLGLLKNAKIHPENE
jgi:hypothetical protein